MTSRAVFPPGEAKEDWAIIRALSAESGQKLPYDNLQELRAALYAQAPHLAAMGTIAPNDGSGIGKLVRAGETIGGEPLKATITDFFLTNPIARASKVMAECSRGSRVIAAQAAE